VSINKLKYTHTVIEHYREYDREHAEIEADWLPNLKHVEGEEGSPVKEEEKELVKEKDEPVAFQILQKRRMSEVYKHCYVRCHSNIEIYSKFKFCIKICV
jgi:hypothetical protein